MAETTSGRLQVRPQLDRYRPPSGFRYELEGLDFCYFNAPSASQVRGSSGSGYAGGGREMNTLQALIGASIFALAFNALIEVAQRGVAIDECPPVSECVVVQTK